MIYIMPAALYWYYIERFKFSHHELIQYLNKTLGLCSPIMELHIYAE